MKTIVMRKREFCVVNLKSQYGDDCGGVMYAVVTDLIREDLEKAYAEELKPYLPYVVVGTYYLEAIREFSNVADKYEKRRKRKGLLYDLDEIAILTYKELQVRDFITDLENEEKLKDDKRRLDRALDKLTEIQRRRIYEKYWKNKSNRTIADEEGKDIKTINESINGAIKKIKKNF